MTLKTLMRGGSGAAVILIGMIGMQGSVVAQVVGKTVAVNPVSTAAGRVLEIGAAVVHNERITTSARGSTQLLFIDRTTLNIGPNSDLLIDEYVFDPNRGVGKMTVSLSKGLMRFVGGRITHNGSASVKTPPATIGIRGGVVDISTNGISTSASNSYGIITVTPSGGGRSVNVPQGSTASSSGGSPTVTVTTPQQASRNNQQLQSQGSQTGGVSQATSSSAASYSNSNTSKTFAITTASNPASGSTAAGPSTAGGGSLTSNPNSPINIFSSLGGTTSPGTSSSTTSSPGGNTPSAAQQTPSSTTSGGGGCAKCPPP